MVAALSISLLLVAVAVALEIQAGLVAAVQAVFALGRQHYLKAQPLLLSALEE
jgi:hypothetical protein